MKRNNLIIKLMLLFTFVTSSWAYSLSQGTYKTYTVSKLANYTYTYKLDVTGGDCDFYGHHSGSPTKDNYYRNSENSSGQDESFSFDSTVDSSFYLSIYAYSDCSYNTPTFSKVAIVSKPNISGGVYIQDITGGFKSSWNTASGTVDYYRLYRSTSSGSLGSQVYQGSSTYYNNTGLSDGVTYYYTARAYNSAGYDSSNQDYKKYVASGDTVPTLTINTQTSSDGTHDKKTENFDISITAESIDGLNRIVYGIYKGATLVSTGYKDVSGVQVTHTFTIDISNLEETTYKIKFLVNDVNGLISENKWYWFDKVSANDTVAYSVTPNSGIVGIENIFTITGQNLPLSIYMNMDNATCDAAYEVTATSAKVKCTPSSLGGQRFYTYSQESTDLNDLISGSSQFSVNVIEFDDSAEAEVFRQEFINYDPSIATILNSANMDAPVSRAEAVIMMEKFLSNKSTVFKNYDMSDYYLAFADADVYADYHSSLLKLSYYEGDNDNITPISKENSLFRPLDKVSRQEFIAIVVQGLDLNILDNRDFLNDFQDSTDLANVARWAWKYFNTAVEMGLMNGNRSDINNPLLEPTANLSVFEAMVILKNANNILAGNFLHTEAKFQSPDSLDISKLLFNQIGYEYMPRYYENSANPINITSIIESTASAEFCGKDNSIVLTVTATTDKVHDSKISEYYWWNTNAGYFREYTGRTNFKTVCFYPATVEPVDGYKIVVNGGDNIGYVDSFTYTGLNTAVIHANDSDNNKVSTVNNISFTNESYMKANSAYSVTVNGSFSKAGIEVGLENITISLVDGVNKSILFKGQAINSKATFIVPDISTLYGEDITLEVTVNTQNAKVTQTLFNIRYLPVFSIKGKVYNTSETDKATYVMVDSTKIYLDENSEFYHVLDLNNEASSLSVAVESSAKNSFETLDVDLTYENSQRFLVFVGKNTILDSDGDGVIDTEDDLPYDSSETIDSDNDGIGNKADLDDDDDGISDEDEILYGFNPLDSSDAAKDADNDGFTNLEEIGTGTNPNSALSYTSTLDLETGWNMLAPPMQVTLNINDLNDSSIKIIRSFQKGSWYIWTDNNQTSTDKPLTVLQNGYGYWVKTTNSTSISFSGEEVSGSIPIVADGKWHMAGSMEISNMETFFLNNPSVRTLWRYVNGKWLSISNNSDIKQSLENANINPVNNIETYEGFMYK